MINKWLAVLSIAILLLNCNQFGQIRIGLIVPDVNQNNETKAAIQFLQALSDSTALPRPFRGGGRGEGSSHGIRLSVLPLSEWRGGRGVRPEGRGMRPFDLIWFHSSDSLQTEILAHDPEALEQIQSYLRHGGKLLLTLDAVRLVNDLGLETTPVESRQVSLTDEGYGRKAGLHSYRSHPLFNDLNGGAFILDPASDTVCSAYGFFGDNIPTKGKVIAVDWSYIFLSEENKLVIQYEQGKGSVLAIGAYTHFAGTNRNRAHLELFMKNVIDYLSNGKGSEPAFYWNYAPQDVQQVTFTSAAVRIPGSKKWDVIPGDLTIQLDSAGGDFWDLASPRMVVMGNESHGIDEIWAHPFMALRDFEAGIRLEGEDTIRWLRTITPEVEIDPAYIRRSYRLPGSRLNEIVTVDPDCPAAVIHYDYSGEKPAQLFVNHCCNLRLMWPYSEKAVPGMTYGWDEGLQAMIIKDGSGDFVTLFGGNQKPFQWLAGKYDSFVISDTGFTGHPTQEMQVTSIFQYQFKPEDFLDVIIAASSEGVEQTTGYYMEVMQDPQHSLNGTVSHYTELPDHCLSITTPSDEFNRGFRWALAGTDRFFVNTPGIGGSLVAGYGTTARGWDGGHRINGRPGYAWYFGRDGQWSGLALLDYGDFEKVRSMLEVYQRFQDLNGKIYHELTTSGAVHYDAADATPLYIVLAGRYLRHSGDLGFIRASWPNIRQAIDFCLSTDTDGDHLIENTGVGHGWVEGGALYGSHTSLYLASCWAAALNEAAYIAEKLGYASEAAGFSKESESVVKIINQDFWNPETDFFHQGKFRDGTYLEEPTILSTIPLYFGQANDEHKQTILETIAGNGFTTNWGVRIISNENPFFNPRAYHSGTVWPLFTGWTALAEYTNGRYIQGYSHIMNNVNVGKYWAKGLIEEVLHGMEYRPSGVCAHQCWSETMVLQPVIEGMLGLEISALDNYLKLSPRFPFNWDKVTVDHIRIANQRLKMDMLKDSKTITYIFTNESSGLTHIDFNPLLPPGWKYSSITLNNEEILPEMTFDDQGIFVHLSFYLTDSCVIRIKGKGGICMLPYVPDPLPGDGASGFRIISSTLMKDHYRAVVEGPAGSKGTFDLYVAEDQLIEFPRKTNYEKILGGYKIGINFESLKKPFVRKEVVVKLK